MSNNFVTYLILHLALCMGQALTQTNAMKRARRDPITSQGPKAPSRTSADQRNRSIKKAVTQMGKKSLMHFNSGKENTGVLQVFVDPSLPSSVRLVTSENVKQKLGQGKLNSITRDVLIACASSCSSVSASDRNIAAFESAAAVAVAATAGRSETPATVPLYIKAYLIPHVRAILGFSPSDLGSRSRKLPGPALPALIQKCLAKLMKFFKYDGTFKLFLRDDCEDIGLTKEEVSKSHPCMYIIPFCPNLNARAR